MVFFETVQKGDGSVEELFVVVSRKAGNFAGDFFDELVRVLHGVAVGVGDNNVVVSR